MKLSCLLLLNFICLNFYGQNQYPDFIQSDNQIKWAAGYTQLLDITPRVKKFGLKQVLFNKISNKQKIDVFYLQDNNLRKVSTSDIGKLPQKWITSTVNRYERYLQDHNLSNASAFITREKQSDCNSAFSNNRIEVYQVRQLLYYKNSRLYIRNMYVTPFCLRDVADSVQPYTFTWESSISSFADYGGPAAVNKKRSIYIANVAEVYNLKYDLQDTSVLYDPIILKNPIFSHHLFEDILKSRVTVTDVLNNIIPANKVLDRYNPEIEVPVYDSLGDLTMTKKVRPEVNLDSFYEFSINQDLFLDTVANKLYSEVKYMEVYRNVSTSMGVMLGRAIFYRIYFIKPALFRKPESKRFLN